MAMNPYIYRPSYFFLRHKDLCGYRKYCLVFFATDFFYLKTVLVFSIFAKHLFPRDSYMRCLNIRHLNSIYMNSIRAQLFDLPILLYIRADDISCLIYLLPTMLVRQIAHLVAGPHLGMCDLRAFDGFNPSRRKLRQLIRSQVRLPWP